MCFPAFRQLIGPHTRQKVLFYIHHAKSVTEPEVWLAMCLAHCRWRIACTHHIQTRVFSLTSTMSHVAKMHLGNCLALKGFAGRRRETGMGDTDTLVEPALDLCVCNRAIYEKTVAPFFQRELLVCLRSCCANISCLGAPAAIVGFAPSPPCFPPCIAIHLICQTHKGRQTHNRGTF